MRISNSTLFGLLLAILMFMPIPLTMVNGTAGPTIGSLNDSSLLELKVGKAPPVPGPDLVESNWTSNRLKNSDFEDWIDQYDCVGWDYSTSPDRYQWVAQAPHPVNEGTYSGGMQIRDLTATADLKLQQNLLLPKFLRKILLLKAPRRNEIHFFLFGLIPSIWIEIV